MKTLPQETIKIVNEYCIKYNEPEDHIRNLFGFIEDNKLLDEVVIAYLTARYIYKLGQGLSCSGNELHAHSKFQIMQYASIYEAVIGYMLEDVYKEHDLVKKLSYGSEFIPSDYSKKLIFSDVDGSNLVLCKQKPLKRDKTAIKFDDKIACCIKIGFIHSSIGHEISKFYKLRNGIHLSNAIKNVITYDTAQAQVAYRRLRPFALGIKDYLTEGKLKSSAMTKDAFSQIQAEKRVARGRTKASK
ncbi:hypothetical protein [Methylobacterium gossipiicola]|nr:hypothetical protein [Methylobacterium gossipiicola]